MINSLKILFSKTALKIEAVRQEVIRAQGENRVQAEEIPSQIDEQIPQQLLVSMFRKFNK